MQIDLIGPADAAPPSLTIPFLQPHLVAATAAPLLPLQAPTCQQASSSSSFHCSSRWPSSSTSRRSPWPSTTTTSCWPTATAEQQQVSGSPLYMVA